MAELVDTSARIDNPCGSAPVLLVCDHATNVVPEAYGALGLDAAQLADHVAWDLGALALAQQLAQVLDAPLVSAPVSRLVIDPNRALDAPDLIAEYAEGCPIPGNQALTAAERAARIAAFHAPYHGAIETALAERPAIAAVVSVHSFTPVLFGETRPWHAGIVHGADARLADQLIAALSAEDGLTVGRNEPYGPGDGVYYTLERHAGGRATVMIEVRNDQLRDAAGQALWARRLAKALAPVATGFSSGSERATRSNPREN